MKRIVGLEHVELVMDVEDEFGIAVPDEVSVTTVGDLHDVVLRLVRESGPDNLRGRADLEVHLWARLIALAAAHGYGVPADQITRTTRFIEDLGYG